MAKVLANIVGYGGDASGVWVAPKGTTAPVGMAVPGCRRTRSSGGCLRTV